MDFSDWDLLARASAHGTTFGALVERHFRSAVAFCHQVLGDFQKAEDIAQRGFAKLFETRRRYRKRAPFRSFLFRVLLNLCLNELRRKSSGIDLSAMVTSSSGGTLGEWIRDSRGRDPAVEIEQRETESMLRLALGQLRPEHRAALYLREYEGESYEEIAQMLDASLAEVKVWIHRARRRVLDLLGPYLDRGEGFVP